eukprot:sb/3471933/
MGPGALASAVIARKTVSSDTKIGERVARLIVLTATSVRPAPCIIPRKNYREFHSDLFPETRGPIPGVDAEGWLNGNDGYRELISLDPAVAAASSKPTAPEAATVEEEVAAPAPPSPENEKHKAIVSNLTQGQSVYRNIEGVLAHKNLNYHGLKNVQSVMPQEGNGFETSERNTDY